MAQTKHLLLPFLALLGLAGSQPRVVMAQAKALTKIRLATSTAGLDFAPIRIAQRKGFFKEVLRTFVWIMCHDQFGLFTTKIVQRTRRVWKFVFLIASRESKITCAFGLYRTISKREGLYAASSMKLYQNFSTIYDAVRRVLATLLTGSRLRRSKNFSVIYLGAN